MTPLSGLQTLEGNERAAGDLSAPSPRKSVRTMIVDFYKKVLHFLYKNRNTLALMIK